jgi:hypothetical protein
LHHYIVYISSKFIIQSKTEKDLLSLVEIKEGHELQKHKINHILQKQVLLFFVHGNPRSLFYHVLTSINFGSGPMTSIAIKLTRCRLPSNMFRVANKITAEIEDKKSVSRNSGRDMK